MLKELKYDDIDNIMRLWKNEFTKSSKLLKNEIIVDKYTKVRNKFISNIKSTIVYTEDGEIQGFISIDENSEIWAIVVKPSIRREGIGTILLENSKTKYSKLTTKVKKNNENALMFFYKNEFKKLDKNTLNLDESTSNTENCEEYILEWSKDQKKKIDLIYFDEDLDKDLINKDSIINFKCINVKQLLQTEHIQETHINNIKTYMKFRKKLEDIIENQKLLLYIDYNNHYSFLDDQIKEIVKIKKVKLELVICEPFTIEGSKKINSIKEIEKAYKDYKINKIDCTIDIKQNINLNQIFKKRKEILLQKMEVIAENI